MSKQRVERVRDLAAADAAEQPAHRRGGTEDNTDGSLASTLILPFGLLLEAGATLQDDDGQPLEPLRFSTCLPAGCVVPLSAADDMGGGDHRTHADLLLPAAPNTTST